MGPYSPAITRMPRISRVAGRVEMSQVPLPPEVDSAPSMWFSSFVIAFRTSSAAVLI